jgi:hypothetical protein
MTPGRVLPGRASVTWVNRQFGLRALNDGHLVPHLLEGRSPTLRTMARVRQFIRDTGKRVQTGWSSGHPASAGRGCIRPDAGEEVALGVAGKVSGPNIDN